ncbi:replication-associated recombination protein A [Fusibacter bizertensis]|uniref:Replication-associated recombination protein A n=1 Tax=Fusibacter bizertensis TaxID=1488331 RepID=A0ABT6N9M1_9FIRM|nr:replication-associated recombination protein A [Fusibacter bizertensis]MDH8677113.1 replication-associated recombination protein A [Fusibacter bizertensis]
MDLFDIMAKKQKESSAPLAERMKPETLDDFVGQANIMGEGKLLPKLIKADRLTSIILYGPPGSGKTSLAKVIAKQTKATFISMNAVTSGVKDIREAVDRAKDELAMYQRRSVLFIDEIHRFNKSQQDALLPFVEDGTFILIGATTENPYFEVNGALISRSSVFRLIKLGVEDIVMILHNALNDETRGLGMYPIEVDEGVLEYIADVSSGDARRALNILELSVLPKLDLSSKIDISINDVEDCIQMKAVDYDKNGDNHYDIVSAFIKSMRGSDPDAALFYLGKMIAGGEDPRFISRRIVICAAEDVGNADPMALVVANNAAQAVDFIGMPEGRIIMAQAVTYVASAPKSNAAYTGINEVLDDISNIHTGTIPYYLKDGTSLSLERKYRQSDNMKSYEYPHAYETHYVKQQYLPDEIKDKRYYRPTDLGYETKINEYLKKTKYAPE